MASELTHKAHFGALSKALDSTEYSDLVIRCGDSIWRVHKVIVCSRSAYFKSACDQLAKVDKKGDEIVIQGFCSKVVECVLLYIYTGDYSAVIKPEVLTRRRQDSVVQASTSHPAPMLSYQEPPQWNASPQLDYGPASSSASKTPSRTDERLAFIKAETPDLFRPTKQQSPQQARTATSSMPPEPKTDADRDIILHVDVYRAAGAFRIAGLKEHAKEKFQRTLDAGWDSGYLLSAAKCLYVRAYEEEDHTLLDLFLQALARPRRLRALLPQLWFRHAVNTIRGFGVDLLAKVVEGNMSQEATAPARAEPVITSAPQQYCNACKSPQPIFITRGTGLVGCDRCGHYHPRPEVRSSH